MKSILAVYPGTFDPFTHGHRDILERGLRIFSRMIVAVAANPEKSPLFTVEERMEIIHDAVRGMEGVRVDAFHTLLVDYVKAQGAAVVIRGLRAISDFEHEFQMALMNRRIAEEIETIFLMPHEAYSYLSSRLVKEVALLGGMVKGLVSPLTERMLGEKYHQHEPGKR
ncbi:MAG: pantetheine-phosphate adenylyltransferase [candidate division NC10 bacterium]|nr:pantetheine-phosphate adenylyltransferase [candidate division NC10 bacterium]MCH7895327.1 pantetheine-phosphate adenylyltransferase [candidate division NC10 bacterium]MCZ6551507.1 pantetheine-phosphate adenylyltransferase [candidate division NC10 bacterium]